MRFKSCMQIIKADAVRYRGGVSHISTNLCIELFFGIALCVI